MSIEINSMINLGTGVVTEKEFLDYRSKQTKFSKRFLSKKRRNQLWGEYSTSFLGTNIPFENYCVLTLYLSVN